MAESIGLIERAAALLRQREAPEPGAPLPAAAPVPVSVEPQPRATEAATDAGPQLILDRGRLAAYGVQIPSSERSRTVEEFRLIKRNLMAAWSPSNGIDGRRDGRSIMVTSTHPGEGKTFVSLNLALAFASERDVKSLLVDIDTHHSNLRTILGIPGQSGIVDVLAGDLDLTEALVRTTNPNLLVLPSGRGGPLVPELFSSNRMGALMAELTRRFADRFIILDTPPCMASSDAATLAPLVSQTVFVVEAHRTQQEEIESSLGMLSSCPRNQPAAEQGRVGERPFRLLRLRLSLPRWRGR